METVVGLPALFTTLLTAIWSGVTKCGETIADNALLLIPLGFVFVGGVIGITKKLMGTRRGRR